MATRLDIGDVYNKVLDVVNAFQGGSMTPGRFNNWAQLCNQEMYDDKFGEKWELTQAVTDALALPFLITLNCVIIQNPGSVYDIIRYPANYGHFSSARVFRRNGAIGQNGMRGIIGAPCAGKDVQLPDGTCKKYEDPEIAKLLAQWKNSEYTEVPVYKWDNQRFGAALDHATKYPTFDSPILTQFNGGFKIAPRGCGILVMDYLKTPTPPVFAYTIGTDDSIVYNQGGSTQPDWNSDVLDEFVNRIAKRYAIYTREDTLYAEFNKEAKESE